MYYYRYKDKYLFSRYEYSDLSKINQTEAMKSTDYIYYLNELELNKSRKSFSISDVSLLSLKEEGINLLQKEAADNHSIPDWILNKIDQRKVISVNRKFPNWQDILEQNHPQKWRINILALGDVGGMLLTGLRLLGGSHISQIGIFDRSADKVKRWEYEMNQVMSPFTGDSYPEVIGIKHDELFDCDMFVFCASRSVPPVGSTTDDVRMVQFMDNSSIIGEYAKMARNKNFRGIFAVVSDPVDLLCKVVFLESNKDQSNNLDYIGLAPEQIRGYGLGVMNGRATYYAKKDPRTSAYEVEGRAFGPHGQGLIIANSIESYDDYLTDYLTEKSLKANIEIRNTGFKPYIAPALSSGTLSILSTIRGQWHYSATFMGGVYMGAKNRLNPSGIELERLDLPLPLVTRLKDTYKGLEDII